MTQVELAELKPCPFCGGEAVLWRAGELADEGIINELAGCYGINPAKPHPFLRMTPKAWNTRALEARIPQEDELRKALEKDEKERAKRRALAKSSHAPRRKD